MDNYPFAYDRLEEFYRKYPNLRLAEFVEPDSPVLLDELDLLFKNAGEIEIPQAIVNQVTGKEEWDGELVAAYLEENRELIQKLLEISKYDTRPSRFRYQLNEETPEIWQARTAFRLLHLNMLHHLRTDNREQAGEMMGALLQFQEASSGPFLIHSLVGNSYQKQLGANLIELAREAMDVREFSERLENYSSREAIAGGLKMEFGSLISLIEAAKKVGDQSEVGERVRSMFMGGTHLDGSKLSENERMLIEEEVKNFNLDELQENYARVLSGLVDALPRTDDDESMAEADPRMNISHYQFSLGQEMMLSAMVPQVNSIALQIVKVEQTNRELQIWNALNQASSAGSRPAELSELVPNFLQEVPINPVTQEPFVLDSEAWTLEAGE